MNDTVVCSQIGNNHKSRFVDLNPFRGDVDGDVLTIQCGRHHPIGDVSAHDIATHNVVEQNGGQIWVRQQLIRRHFQRLEQRGERRIGRSKHCERTLGAQIIRQARCNHCRFKNRVIWALHDDVHHSGVHRWLWQQDSVNHVHHPVVRCQIGNRHQGGFVDDYTFRRDVDRDVLAIEHGHHHAVGDVTAHDIATRRVVRKHLRENGACQEHLQCHAQIRDRRCQRIICRRENRERTFAIQGLIQSRLNQSRLQRLVHDAFADDVHHRGVRIRAWQQDSIDHMHDAVVCCDVRDGDHRRAIDDDAIGRDVDDNIFTVQGGC